MLLSPKQSVAQESCINCKFALQSETSETGLRCGQSYYALPALKRKPIPHNNYPVIDTKNHCDQWLSNSNGVLSH